MFLYFSFCFYVPLLLRNKNGGISTKNSLNDHCHHNPKKGGKWHIFIFSLLFWCLRKVLWRPFSRHKTFLRHHKKVWKQTLSFFISIILGCSGQEGLKVFLPGIFISKKMVTNVKLAFTNMPFLNIIQLFLFKVG